MVMRWPRMAGAAAMTCFGGLAATAGAGAPPDYDFDWAIIGDPGNAPYMGGLGEQSKAVHGRGSVDYAYRISKLEVTSAQWLPFLNTFAKQSGNPFSFGRPSWSGLTEIPGPPGHWRLNPDFPNAAMMPVSGPSWVEAAMYCNWLHNGKPTQFVDIMHGAYDLLDDEGNLNPAVTRSPNALFFLPTMDEWLKAAHYDANRHGEGEGGWWRYSHSSDEPPTPGLPGVGQTSGGDFLPDAAERLIPLGSYVDIISPWGLWDTSGGATEYLEDRGLFNLRRIDGSRAGDQDSLMNDHIGYFTGALFPGGGHGFRVASAIPVPGTCFGCAGLTIFSLRRRKR